MNINQFSKKFDEVDEKDKDLVTLSLSPRSGNGADAFSDQPIALASSPKPKPQPQPQPQEGHEMVTQSFMQTMLPPTLNLPQSPFQLSANHPIFNANPYVPDVPTQPPPAFGYPQEVPPAPFSVPPPPTTAPLFASQVPPIRTPRARRNPTQALRDGKSETVPPPFPWATSYRATVYSYDYLVSHQIYTITGDVQCKRCDKEFQIGYDLREKFPEVANFIAANKSAMHDRAPPVLMNPMLPKCDFCDQENSVKPVISEKKKSINWLFLLLGQMLGCCTLEQLKYFCKHTRNHRTGAKDRVLYLTYLGLCKQLNPDGPFDR